MAGALPPKGYNAAAQGVNTSRAYQAGQRVRAGLGTAAKYAVPIGIAGATLYTVPRIIGSMLPAETKEQVAQNPVGSFLTGLDPNDPVIQRNAMIDRAENHAQQMRQELKDDTMEMARFQTDLAYEEAKRRAPLEYGWGSAVKFRDVYANQLDNQVNNYLRSMANTNQAVATILEGSKLQIM